MFVKKSRLPTDAKSNLASETAGKASTSSFKNNFQFFFHVAAEMDVNVGNTDCHNRATV